jgi:hypothetical protein
VGADGVRLPEPRLHEQAEVMLYVFAFDMRAYAASGLNDLREKVVVLTSEPITVQRLRDRVIEPGDSVVYLPGWDLGVGWEAAQDLLLMADRRGVLDHSRPTMQS